MIALKGYLFIIGAVFSYAPLFLTNMGTAVLVNAIGITISLYIWYALAVNRDRYISGLIGSGAISERDLRVLGLRKNARLFVAVYSMAFVAMTLSLTFVMRTMMENFEALQEAPNAQAMIDILGTGYVIVSGLFTVSAIVTLVFLYKLLDTLLNDDMKLQSLLGKRRKLPVIALKPVSIPLLIFLIVLSYGLFSWFLRYRIAVAQRLFGKLEAHVKELEDQKRREQEFQEKLTTETTEKAASLDNTYEKIFERSPEGEERREILASFYKELSEIDDEKARSIIRKFLEKNLISEREYRRIENLIS